MGRYPGRVPLTGFPAHQEYWKQKRTQITTRMNGTILQPQVYTNTHNPHHPQSYAMRLLPTLYIRFDAAAMMAASLPVLLAAVTRFQMLSMTPMQRMPSTYRRIGLHSH